MTRPTLLILSFSPIAADARVLKQVRHFSQSYDVTTCGYGEAPEGVLRHIRIPDDKPQNDLSGRLITLRLYGKAYWSLSAVSWCRTSLEPGSWDIILADDVETAPLALWLRARLGLHADLHEYSPRLHEENPAWVRRIQPFYNWLCRRFVARADSVTTVGQGIADEYKRVFGIDAAVVKNAAPYAELSPTPVGNPIRLVHSGACLRNRNVVGIVDAVEASATRVTLDLYLTPNDPGHLQELKARAAASDRIVVHDPVPYSELIETLNGYDVGVHILPPVSFNNAWALPNKFFDYVQARLGLIIGPSHEMARLLEEYRCGAIAADFTTDALVAVLESLTGSQVEAFKRASDAAARDLSAESQIAVWDQAIAGIARKAS